MAPIPMTAPTAPLDALQPAPSAAQVQGVGVLLFLFIPLVLFLFVRHPQPIAASAAAGLALMVVHRRLARPYMMRVAPYKCLWCNRLLAGAPATLDLRTGGDAVLPARCCASHRAPAARFLRFLVLARWPLRIGIFVPLLLLLAALAAAAFGHAERLPAATALFQLLIGCTVSAAAWGYLLLPDRPATEPLALPFPVHNFFLLGLRLLLWIFRLVGAWWIVRGILFFAAS